MRRLLIGSTGVFWAAVLGLGLARIASARSAPDTASVQQRPPRTISPEELSAHATAADCWIAVRGRVYDVTTYIEQHPTEPEVITETCGTDATVAFETRNSDGPHSPRAWEQLETLYIGDLER